MPNPTCPTGCETSLAPVAFSVCAPEVNLSEIARLYIATADSAGFTDWKSPTEWAARLSNTLTTAGKIRRLTVIADKPAPTAATRDISGGRTITSNKTHVVNFTIDETNSINHDWLRQLECGGQFKIWYETIGGLLFGGNSGIIATVTADMVVARGTEEILVYNGTATWKNRFTEERAISPIAA